MRTGGFWRNILPVKSHNPIGAGEMVDQGNPTRLQAANPQSWVEQHGDYLFRYALRRLQDRQAAEDLVQETFLAGLHGLEDFQGRSNERTWLLAILKHKIIDYIRKASKERSLREDKDAEEFLEHFFKPDGTWAVRPSRWPGNPLKKVEQGEFWKVFQICLKQLPERMAHAFALRELEGLGIDEISKVLRVTANNMSVILYRARALLRHCLEKNWST
ncbi:MAG: sigma-70 family RNA polymerase sigma factor [Desulfobacteraceae bacterium]|nr:MAG: sigma-70 family RNA polymerase sigma factor [Desulfobacteraceae bacterium]